MQFYESLEEETQNKKNIFPCRAFLLCKLDEMII